MATVSAKLRVDSDAYDSADAAESASHARDAAGERRRSLERRAEQAIADLTNNPEYQRFARAMGL